MTVRKLRPPRHPPGRSQFPINIASHAQNSYTACYG
jgi:hypothetical protein